MITLKLASVVCCD